MEESCHEISTCCSRNRGSVFCIVFILIVIGIVLIVVLGNKTLPFPCYLYNSQTLANEINIDCIQYIWKANACKNPAIYPPNGYTGFWTQSPQGTKMVKCVGQTQGTSCGIGSYQNIVIYMQFCNPYFNG
jgi:hypothetical protein